MCDQPTDRPTDTVTYRVACTRLKMENRMVEPVVKSSVVPLHYGPERPDVPTLNIPFPMSSLEEAKD